jgi:hypothetical protein
MARDPRGVQVTDHIPDDTDNFEIKKGRASRAIKEFSPRNREKKWRQSKIGRAIGNMLTRLPK